MAVDDANPRCPNCNQPVIHSSAHLKMGPVWKCPEYVPERGYWVGVTLAPGEKPWPLLWEQHDNDACAHEWERVVVTYRHREPEPVVRCRRCHVPRCGDSTDRDPCMERRHHQTVHLTLSGLFDPVGGYLQDEEPT